MTIPKPTQKQLIIVSAVILAITAALILAALSEHVFPQLQERVEQVIDPQSGVETPYRHPLTGEPSFDEVERPHIYGVMVENMVEAWPLSGIDQAFLVIEAPVEAAIPRLLAFYYQGQEVNKIGPVRSARPYYLNWNEELEAMYVHVGGSPDALNQIRYSDMLDLNEFYYGWFFWRSDSRSAPHNTYISSELLDSAYEEVSSWETVLDPEYGLWSFKDDVAEDERPEYQMVTMNFSPYFGGLYEAGWEYDPETNDYVRYQSGYEMTLLEGDGVRANNIAILETDIVVLDEIGRRQITTAGEGPAMVIQDGQVIMGTWSKPSSEGRLRFYDNETGEEIMFNAGVTWIEVLDDLEDVKIKT